MTWSPEFLSGAQQLASPVAGAGPTYVLSGGGNLGALQVGMLQALVESGVHPSRIVGTSIGAINGAFFAGRPSLDGIAEIAQLWRSLRRRSVLRPNAITLVRGLAGMSDHLFDSLAIREVVRSFLNFDRLEESPIPLAVVATDAHTMAPVVLDQGDATVALLASSAVPRLLPPVEISGRRLIDGAGAADIALREAAALGASEVYVLATAPLQVTRVISELASWASKATSLAVHVITAPSLHLPYADLDHSQELIDLGYERAREALKLAPVQTSDPLSWAAYSAHVETSELRFRRTHAHRRATEGKRHPRNNTPSITDDNAPGTPPQPCASI